MSKKIIFLGLVFISVLQESYAQNIVIHISGSPNKAFLYELIGEKTILCDSFPAKEDGYYRFSLSKTVYHKGFYRLLIDKNKSFDFLNDDDDVSIITNYKSFQDSLHVITSESNKMFFHFQRLTKLFKTKTELLQLVLARYPKDDDYYKSTQDKLANLQIEYIEFVNTISQKNPGSYIARYIKSAQLLVISSDILQDRLLSYLKAHALDKVDFNDYQLIYSDVYVSKTIEYLTYYRNPQLPKELLEKEFMSAIDTILNKAKVNQIVYQHIVEYLIDGFKKFGFDKTLDYIVNNYVIKDDLCLDDKTEGLIKRRIDQARILKVGMVAPNFIIPDSSGNNIDLYKLTASKILLVFYASWCPHCQDLLPKLKELQNTQIVAISLDTNRINWLNFARNNSSKYFNVSDLKGWDGKASHDYFIYATPTMFLLDSNKNITGKPVTYEELISILK